MQDNGTEDSFKDMLDVLFLTPEQRRKEETDPFVRVSALN